MSNFVMSQVEQVKAGMLAVDDGSPYDKMAVSYNARDRNKPVNLDAVSTFEPKEYQNLEDGNQVTFPIICFYKLHGGTLTWWYYPPTEDGKARRDADLAWLCATFCTRAQQSNSLSITYETK